MPIRVHNTLTGRKEEFVPLRGQEVGMYTCGPTVYDYIHIGNARCLVAHDVIRRYLEYRGYKVTYVQNFTDIDDKMINRAHKLGWTVAQVAEKYINEYFADADALGIKRADVHPRATEHIEDMRRLVENLIKKGHAYEVGGDVYYDITTFKEYGKLSHQKLDELAAGSRVAVEDKKRNPMDFVLWKKQKPGEPAWDSPWGKGRPGWHLECSAMSMRYLGETFDIHAGGADLIFPHHENEIAQSEAATGKPFARYWIHNAYLNIEGEKMSKSLGNFLLVHDLRQKYDPEVIRFFLISAHYRSPLNFTEEGLSSAQSALQRLRNTVDNLEYHRQHSEREWMSDREKEYLPRLRQAREEFIQAMDDDFNTADALAALFDLNREVNTHLSGGISRELATRILDTYHELGEVLGILVQDRVEQQAGSEMTEELIKLLLEVREDARRAKDWPTADKIRDRLGELGVTVEDTPQGSRWKLS